MKTKKYAVLAALAVLSTPVNAEVFKCKIGESKTVYQTTPCANADDIKQIDIKRRSAEKEAQAVEELKQWQAKYEAEQAAERAAIQAENERMLREAEVTAQQNSADAEHRQAQAIEEGKMRPVFVFGR